MPRLVYVTGIPASVATVTGRTSIGGMHGGAGDRLVVYQRRWKLVLFALYSLVFVVLGLWIGGFFSSVEAPLGLVIAATYVGVPLFGLCLLYWVYGLVVRKPALVLSEEGILDNASAIGAGMIRWEEIKDLYTFQYGRESLIGIVPTDEEAILARQTLARRLIMRINKRLVGSSINIPRNTLRISDIELFNSMKSYHQSWEGREGKLQEKTDVGE